MERRRYIPPTYKTPASTTRSLADGASSATEATASSSTTIRRPLKRPRSAVTEDAAPPTVASSTPPPTDSLWNSQISTSRLGLPIPPSASSVADPLRVHDCSSPDETPDIDADLLTLEELEALASQGDSWPRFQVAPHAAKNMPLQTPLKQPLLPVRSKEARTPSEQSQWQGNSPTGPPHRLEKWEEGSWPSDHDHFADPMRLSVQLELDHLLCPSNGCGRATDASATLMEEVLDFQRRVDTAVKEHAAACTPRFFMHHMQSAEEIEGLQEVLRELHPLARQAVYDRSTCPFTTEQGFGSSFHSCVQEVQTQQALTSGRPAPHSDTSTSEEAILAAGTVDYVVLGRQVLTHAKRDASGGRMDTHQAHVAHKADTLAADAKVATLQATLEVKRGEYDKVHESLCRALVNYQADRRPQKENRLQQLQTCEITAAHWRQVMRTSQQKADRWSATANSDKRSKTARRERRQQRRSDDLGSLGKQPQRQQDGTPEKPLAMLPIAIPGPSSPSPPTEHFVAHSSHFSPPPQLPQMLATALGTAKLSPQSFVMHGTSLSIAQLPLPQSFQSL